MDSQRLDPGYMQGRVNPRMLESLMVRILTNPVLFQEASKLLKPEHFSTQELGFAAIWRAALMIHERGGELSYTSMVDVVDKLINDDPEGLSVEEYENIMREDPSDPGMLYWTFERVVPGKLDLDTGRQLLRQFMEERTVADELRKIFTHISGTPSNLMGLLQPISEQLNRIGSASHNPVKAGIPDDWTPKPTRSFTTGLEFLDRYMDGGHAPGEVNGVIAPLGSGKTTLAIHLCVEAMKSEMMLAAEEGRQPRQVYLVSYEQTEEYIRQRMLSCAAGIALDTVKNMTDPETDLSRRGNYKPYEEERFANRTREERAADPEPKGEYERYLDARPMLNKCMRIVDFCQQGGQPGNIGSGFVEEIAAAIARDGRETDSEPALVVVDYVYAACMRRIGDALGDITNLRHLVTMFPDEIKRKVAERYDIPVWVMHQFSGEANEKSPTKLLHHSQASESKSFAMYLSFCVCFGNRDPMNHCLRMQVTKRRRAGDPQPPMLLRIAGDMVKIVSAEDTHRVDKQTGSILVKEVADRFQGNTDAPAQGQVRSYRQYSADGTDFHGI